MKFNQKQAEHEIVMTKLSHSFAMKMALMVCWSIVSVVSILGISLGATTTVSISVIAIVAVILGIISFSVTRSACL